MATFVLTEVALKATFLLMSDTIDAGVLDKWITETDDGMAILMKKTGLSFHMLDRIRRGKYVSTPRKSTVNAILSATGIDKKKLLKPAS